ncbi:MAG: AarF/ABC1/UbiB kinase family protein [Deltaproteobacteria bacterium]|nr:AarF/ABC1/UbiB kinase family protein [Deltaproteobacteria bacterium]MBK8715425.1 AarF/ABC1/UbiB kinase family protein [Deltaproteobacteria bacterium]MBP7287688.1 AarF/ABC1/UbiB kinase family protein [Nannocystaceae bacterium]
MNDRPVTKGRRLLRLASMTAQVAGGYAKSRIKAVFQSDADAERDRAQTHARSGELIAKTLGELKGAVMKVGQMASIAKDILPRELAEALATLQREAPPMPFDVIEEQIERELGQSPHALFQRFDRTPFAAASIGQVHRATTDDGREVVVKVQYPGVDEAVDSDLAHLRLALRASGLLKIERKALDALFDEIRRGLHEELDYCNEADNVRFFREHYRDNPDVVVPEVIGERSSQRVLTLGFEPGDHVDQTDEYPQELRDRLGALLFRTVCEQIFSLQTIHADPNPANFAFRSDGRLVFYDFGCVKRLQPEIVAAYKATVLAGLGEDYDGVEAGLLRLGARNPAMPAVPASYYKMWRDIFARPFVGDDPFDYAAANMHRDALEHVPGFLAKWVSSFQPPAELVFLDRVVVGHYGTMRRLGARGAFGPLLRPFLGP